MATEPLLRTAEAAAVLGVSDETVRRWTKDGRISHVKMPSGQVRYRRSDLDGLLREVEATAEPA